MDSIPSKDYILAKKIFRCDIKVFSLEEKDHAEALIE